MQSRILGLLAVGLLAGTTAQSASIRTYYFTVTIDEIGPIGGSTWPGSFSFYDSIVPALGGSVTGAGLFTDFSFSFCGTTCDETSVGTDFLGFDASGNLTGFLFGNDCTSSFGCIVPTVNDEFLVDFQKSSAPGQDDVNLFKYYANGYFYGHVDYRLWSVTDDGGGGSTVAEPGTLALLGFGLAGLGLGRRRKTP